MSALLIEIFKNNCSVIHSISQAAEMTKTANYSKKKLTNVYKLFAPHNSQRINLRQMQKTTRKI